MKPNVFLNPECINSNAKVVIVKPKHLKSHALHLRNHLKQGHIIVVKNLHLSSKPWLYAKSEIQVEYDPINIKDSISSNKRNFSHHRLKKPDLKSFAELVAQSAEEKKSLIDDMRTVEMRALEIAELITNLKLQCKSTWRYTSTKKTFYHFDDISNRSPINIKCFWNLSEQFREWKWGHLSADVAQLLETSHNKWLKDIPKKDIHHNSYNRYLNSIMQEIQAHSIRFEKYDFWITDSQKTAHQCTSGNKVAVFDCYPHPEQDQNSQSFLDLDYREYLNTTT